MKVQNKYQIVLFVLLCFATIVSAQVTDKDEAFLKHREVERVAQLMDYISFMGNKKKTMESRKYYYNKALNFFVSNGNAYEEDGVIKDGVLVEVTTFPKGTIRRYLIRDFLKMILNGIRPPSIEVSSAEIVIVNTNEDHIQLIEDDGVISCESGSQMIVRNKEGRSVVETLPTRKIKFTVNKSDEGYDDGIHYISKIGNISIVERAIR